MKFSIILNFTVEDTCGGNLQAWDTPLWFTSPGYPQAYPDSTECVWIISDDQEDFILTLIVNLYLFFF